MPAARLLAAQGQQLVERTLALLASEDISEFDAQLTQPDEETVPVKISAKAFEVSGRVLVQWSISDARELNKLEQQLRQAHRMEAVGRLAGGIAHDFNNLLTVITMYCDLMIGRVDDENPLCADIDQVKKAGERAASLTRQLLAFSRQQVLRPQTLDLNNVVTDLGTLLRRLIREDIELKTELTADLGWVEADKGQLEQVLMNLVVNARDAMPAGGQLRVQTSTVTLDHETTGHDPMLPAGHYVVLEVSDTGSGIEPEALPRIFEPFYTTKELGKGTGLGLSTVYGIVKQSGGFIFADSEGTIGTRFRVYLPRLGHQLESADKRSVETLDLCGSETVLVVEDEDDLRNLVAKVLRAQGYKVLEAENGADALQVLAGLEGETHLMVTDLVMPGMSGRELSIQARGLTETMKVLFMSGYSNEAISQHGLLAPGTRFLEKPFTAGALALTVRQLLNGDDLI